MSERTKIAFMFGAGAEGKGNFDICSGLDYLKETLFMQQPGILDELQTYFPGDYYNDARHHRIYKYRRDSQISPSFILKNLVLSTALNNEAFYLRYKDPIRCIVDNDMNDLHHAYHEDTESLKVIREKNRDYKQQTHFDKKDLENELKFILDQEKCPISKVKCDILRDILYDKDTEYVKVDVNIAVSGIMDEYFHTIISPRKYGTGKFSKVFNYYWKSYFVILKYVLQALNELNNNKFNKYFKNGELDYEYILNHLKELTCELYDGDLVIHEEGTYYDWISRYLKHYENEIECCGVITTNYYRFCEDISPNTIYLNGQLKYFECPENLDFIDLTTQDIEEGRLFFPFIFGQSLVKPIVGSTQTEEFHKLHELLLGDESVDVLVIIGYNINEDDNHINSFLHEYLKKDNKTLIMMTNDDEFDIKERLHYNNDIYLHHSKVKLCLVDYMSEDDNHSHEDVVLQNKKNIETIFGMIHSYENE